MVRIEGLTKEELELKIKSQKRTSIIETTQVVLGKEKVTMGRYYCDRTNSYECVKRI